MKLIFILLIISISSAFAIEEDEKLNACFVTINSSEEKQEFTKALNSPPNKGKFNIIELIEEDSSSDWFDKACEKKIRCDLLLISGHFGGSFFGKSSFSLDIRELEKKSCNKSCESILSEPKEVFLMGCNTLAGKAQDNRSSSEYLHVLLNEGIELQQAQQIVEQRYGLTSTSFFNTMKRSFKNVPHLYGFHSVGPSGANVQFLLRDYLKKKKNYHQHLMKIELQRALAIKGKIEAWNRKNNTLAKSLKSTNFAQTAGILIADCKDNSSMSPSNPDYEMMKNICKLVDEDISEDHKAKHILDILQLDDFEVYIGHISDLVSNNYEISEILSTLTLKDNKLKNKLLSVISKMKTGVAKAYLAQTLRELSITSEELDNEIFKDIVLDYLKMPVTVEAKDALCSLKSMSDQKIYNISLKDLNQDIFQSKVGMQALACISNSSGDILNKTLSVLKTTKSPELKASAYLILGTSKESIDKVLEYLHESAKSKNLTDKALSLYTLLLLNDLSFDEHSEAEELMHSDEKIKTADGEIFVASLFRDLYNSDGYNDSDSGP